MTGPEPREPYGRRPLPARSDWRQALHVYRGGRSRSLTFDEKRRIAEATGDAPIRRAPEPDEADRSSRPARTIAPGYGVPIPPEFAFHRNAGNWRNRLDGEGKHGDAASD